MRELPIGMKEALVAATEEGRKTQTSRRGGLDVVNEEPEAWTFSQWMSVASSGYPEPKRPAALMLCHGGHTLVKCRWAVDDLLYVSETTALRGVDADGAAVSPAYKALGHTTTLRWKSGRFMKKTDARIWLRVTEVQVRRVQSLTPEEIRNEGVLILASEEGRPLWALGEKNAPIHFLPQGLPMAQVTAWMVSLAWWGALWSRINGRESWDRNEWVWVVKFVRHREHEAEYRAWKQQKVLATV